MRRRVTVVGCVCMCVCVCLSVKSHHTSGASVRPENTVTYSAGNGGQKICGVFFETAPFKSYGVKRKRKSQLLIRSSLLWLTSDQVFLFDVQRSTSGYCMREYKHAYCSGQSYSASSSCTEPTSSYVPFQNSRTRVIDCARADAEVLHFSAFIGLVIELLRLCHVRNHKFHMY